MAEQERFKVPSGLADTFRQVTAVSRVPEFKQPPGLKAMMAIAEGGLASEFCKRLTEYCRTFDAQLDADHEVGAKLVSYGETVRLYVEGIGYDDPNLIHFDGVLDDAKTPVRLVQHVSQISFLLMALPKEKPEQAQAVVRLCG